MGIARNRIIVLPSDTRPWRAILEEFSPLNAFHEIAPAPGRDRSFEKRPSKSKLAVPGNRDPQLRSCLILQSKSGQQGD
jgi:hypothetical protein